MFCKTTTIKVFLDFVKNDKILLLSRKESSKVPLSGPSHLKYWVEKHGWVCTDFPGDFNERYKI